MIDPQILQKVHDLELHVRRLMRGLRTGDVHSKIKGIGFEFNQIREYQQGDDVRFIDWKGSARSGKMLVKECFEEQKRTIVIMIDGSSTEFYGSQEHLKFSIMAQAAGALALAGTWHKDRVSIVVVTYETELVLPAKTGKRAVYAMIEKLFATNPSGKQPSLSPIFKSLVERFKRDALVFILSDFLNTQWEDEIKKVSRRVELVAIRCLDRNEKSLSLFGPLTMVDMNRSEPLMLSSRQMKQFHFDFAQRLSKQKKTLERYGVACLDIESTQDFIEDMIMFLKTRLRRR